MAWIISDVETKELIMYLKQLLKLRPTSRLKAKIRELEQATALNMGKEL